MHINYIYPDIPLRSILYIVGDQDIIDTGERVIDFPAQTAQLHRITLDPTKLLIIEQSGAHGTELLESTGVNETILQWIIGQMPISH